MIIGHYLEFLKISKQTSELSYLQLTRNMIKHKGLIGVLDGYFPWGSIQVSARARHALCARARLRRSSSELIRCFFFSPFSLPRSAS